MGKRLHLVSVDLGTSGGTFLQELGREFYAWCEVYKDSEARERGLFFMKDKGVVRK